MKHFDSKIIILLGRSGCGKGTQAKLLINKFGLEYFGSGDVLRERQKVKDFTGKKIVEILKKGEFVPSFIISKLWIDALEKLKQKKRFNGLIFDGTPRKLMEAQMLNDALNWYQWQKGVQVILIDISAKESFERLTKRARFDDNFIVIKKRLAEFQKEVVPVLNFYKKQNRLIKINGEQSIENVFKDILKSINIKISK
jgi:adenylate kinase